MTEEYRRQLEAQFGFDKPIAVQYWDWLVVNKMGMNLPSYDYPDRTAWQLIKSRIPVSLWFGLASFLLPMNLKKSIEVINAGKIHDLDYGVINGHPFFCTCGMGFDAFVSMKFAESGKRGPISYAENILREGLKYEPETYTLEDETGTKQYKAFLISCANASQYGNNAYIAPQASMSDGLIDVVIMEPFDVIEAPQVSFDMFNKTLDKNSKIKSFRCKKLHITRSHCYSSQGAGGVQE